MSNDTRAVQDVIDQRKQFIKNKKKHKRNRLLRILLSHLAIVVMIVSFIFLKGYQFKDIEVKGLNELNISEITSELNLKDISLLNFGPLSLNNLENSPMLASIELDASQLNTFKFKLVEVRIVAYLEEDSSLWLSETGAIIKGNHDIIDVPMIYGYTDSELVLLAQTLAALKPSTLIQINSIKQAPQSFDNKYALIRMQDGIKVNSGFKGITVLDHYESILKALNPEHKCLSIDELSLVPYSFPCTLENE